MRNGAASPKTKEAGIEAGAGFFDHVLEQLARHSFSDIDISAAGDYHIDPNHTVEDTGIALGLTVRRALGGMPVSPGARMCFRKLTKRRHFAQLPEVIQGATCSGSLGLGRASIAASRSRRLSQNLTIAGSTRKFVSAPFKRQG